MKEALLYSQNSDQSVTCHLCSHRCRISRGEDGRCRVRRNSEGTLYSLVFGEVAALANDPIEKKPLFHFLPGSKAFSMATVGCNLTCRFCQNFTLSQAPPDSRFSSLLTPEQLVERAGLEGALSIAYTYSEPTVFAEYAYETGVRARKRGLKNIFVTNGFMSDESHVLLKEFLDAANVDLKSFSDVTYRNVLGGRLDPVLDNIRWFHASGIWIEITTLLVPGLNDSPEELRLIAEFIASVDPAIPWHISRFHPDYQMDDSPVTPVSTMRMALEIGRSAGLLFVYTGNLLAEETAEHTTCPKCSEILIARNRYQTTQVFHKRGKCNGCGYKLPGLFDSQFTP